MGIDWEAFIRIHSPNESDLDKLQENFLTYCKRAFQKDEGWVQRTPNMIRYSFSPHTVGLSASRITETDAMDLYLLDCILRDFPSCYVKGFWYADSGYTHEYIAYWDSANNHVISKYVGYECVDEDFYRHHRYKIQVNPLFKPNTTDLYEVNFRIESYTYTGGLDIEQIEKIFPLEHIKRYGFHSDYIDVFYSTNKIDFELFYSLLRKTSCSYLKVDWERMDKTLAGIWVGHNKNGDITHHSISFLPEPQEVYIDEAPTQEELDYNVYEEIEKEELDQHLEWDTWPVDEPFLVSPWYPEFQSDDTLHSYENWLYEFYRLEEFLEDLSLENQLQQDYEDCCIYLDNRPLYEEDEDDIPRQDELLADQINIDEEAHRESWWWREKSDDILEDIRYTYRCHSIWHTYEELNDRFTIPSPVGGYWYLKHRNGDVFHSEDEGILEYFEFLSEHDVYADIEKEEEEEIPDDEEFLLDDARTHALWERALDLGWEAPKSYLEWEEVEWYAHYWEQSPERDKQDQEDYEDHLIYLEE